MYVYIIMYVSVGSWILSDTRCQWLPDEHRMPVSLVRCYVAVAVEDEIVVVIV